jgi:putative ABC transport system permease protein
MNALFIKALADLRTAWRQALLAVAALAVGMWGVGGVFVSYSILTRDLRENFVSTRPAHAVLVSPDFARLDVSAWRQQPDIDAAELRDLAMLRIEAFPGQWIPLWLFGVEDAGHATMATLRPQQGAATPPPGTLLVERDGLKVSNLRLGATARVRAAGRIVELPVAGVTFDPAQAPATQDHFIYGYADKATYAGVSGLPADQRLVLRFKDVHGTADVQRKLQPLLADLAAQGVHLQSVQVPGFEEHPHQWQLDTLLMVQGAVGLLAFLMGAVLVSQLMASMLARQVREIGIMKAIGASRQQVLALYAGMVLAMAAVAGAVAAPWAVLSGNAFARFVAGKLNFDILTTQVPPLVALALGAGSLLMPLAAALPVLLRGTNHSVLDALGDQATRGSRPPSLRHVATILTMALGVAIFDTGFNVRQSLAELLADMDRSMGHDVQVVLRAPLAPQAVLPLFDKLPGLARVEAWNGGRGELQSHVVATSQGIGIVALPWDTTLFRPRLAAGRWLRGAGDVEVVLNRAAVDLYGHPDLGSPVELSANGRTVRARLAGIVDELEKPKIYIDLSHYDAAFNPQHSVNSLMLVAGDKRFSPVMALKREVERVIEGSQLDVLYVMSQAERVRVIADHLDIVLSVLVALSLLVLLVSAMGMSSAMAIGIQERTREIGVMRAIGATPGMVFRRFVAEGMQVGAASIVLGLVAAWPLGVAACTSFGRLMLGENARLRFAFSPLGLAVVVGVTLALAWAASTAPARRAVRIPTRDALSCA